MPAADRTLAETHGRFWSRVEVASRSGCWIWKGTIRSGYGRFKIRCRYFSAHRLAYEWLVGPIPAGMTLDHTCHNGTGCNLGSGCPHRACVNPAHLEPVSMTENLARGMSPSARPDLYPAIYGDRYLAVQEG